MGTQHVVAKGAVTCKPYLYNVCLKELNVNSVYNCVTLGHQTQEQSNAS